jgi:hypothetical protein
MPLNITAVEPSNKGFSGFPATPRFFSDSILASKLSLNQSQKKGKAC